MQLITGGGVDVMHDAHRLFLLRLIKQAIDEYDIEHTTFMLKTDAALFNTRSTQQRPYFSYEWRKADIEDFLDKHNGGLPYRIIPYNDDSDTRRMLNSHSVIGASEYYTGMNDAGRPIIRLPEIGGHHSSDIYSELMLAQAHSPCHYVNVGAVLLRQGNIVTSGYNDNDCDSCPKTVEWRASGKPNYNDVVYKNACTAVHAEERALILAEPGDDLIITHSPCIKCVKLILEKQIRRVVYLREYVSTEGLEYLRDSDIQIRKAGL